jgi:hypothetical protein
LTKEIANEVCSKALEKISQQIIYIDWEQLNAYAFSSFLDELFQLENFVGAKRVNTFRAISEQLIQYHPIIEVLSMAEVAPETIVEALKDLHRIFQRYEKSSLSSAHILIEIILPILKSRSSILKDYNGEIVCGTFKVMEGTYYII